MMRNKAGQGTDLSEHAHLVNLLDHRVQHFALEGPEYDGLVFDGVDDEALTRLDNAGADLVYRRDGYHKSVLACAGALHLRV